MRDPAKRLCGLLFGAGWLLLSGGVPAHEGEDHSHAAPPPPGAVTLEPRVEAASREVELVGILQHGELLIYLDRYASNEPLDNARLSVDIDNRTLPTVPVSPGLYRLSGADGLNRPGAHELLFTLEAGELRDVLIGTLTVPAPAAPPEAGRLDAVRTDYLWLGGAGALGLLAGWLLGRRRSSPSLALLTAGLLALSVSIPPAAAHEGEEHGGADPAGLSGPVGSAPTRLPDGSLFVPKPVQRLLGIRTVPAELRDTPQAIELNGHLIADPNLSGRVQATQAGRLEPAPEGLPHLGQTVRAGQVLAYLVPLAATLETASQQAQLAELNSQADLAEQRLARLQKLSGSVAQREVEEVRTDLEGLRQRRAALKAGLSLHEPLRAPVDGVISAALAVAGQVVEARETLFEVINPRRWWVEAVVYEAALSGRIRAAVAQTLDGQVLPLRLLGMGYQRRGQGLPLQFRIEGEVDHLSAGQPVRILVKTQETVRGVPVPRDSLVRGTGGETLVWVHTRAEHFAPRPVRAQAVDGNTWVVTEGLNPGERVVSQGAALLAQVH